MYVYMYIRPCDLQCSGHSHPSMPICCLDRNLATVRPLAPIQGFEMSLELIPDLVQDFLIRGACQKFLNIYKCTLCKETFNSKKKLEMHIRTHEEPPQQKDLPVDELQVQRDTGPQYIPPYPQQLLQSPKQQQQVPYQLSNSYNQQPPHDRYFMGKPVQRFPIVNPGQNEIQSPFVAQSNNPMFIRSRLHNQGRFLHTYENTLHYPMDNECVASPHSTGYYNGPHQFLPALGQESNSPPPDQITKKGRSSSVHSWADSGFNSSPGDLDSDLDSKRSSPLQSGSPIACIPIERLKEHYHNHGERQNRVQDFGASASSPTGNSLRSFRIQRPSELKTPKRPTPIESPVSAHNKYEDSRGNDLTRAELISYLQQYGFFKRLNDEEKSEEDPAEVIKLEPSSPPPDEEGEPLELEILPTPVVLNIKPEPMPVRDPQTCSLPFRKRKYALAQA
ncbi:hypothetical protein TCAL_17230 [Tigriopus californicus]|uniref:C2H2-type domain-containing protein n=1 Tax=Tigriopus californicus TaxID=6832 RepID=A0A553N8A7_TIGCA|nr:hypothetical protein TCAL_17230 [Tigriopus californicus]